MEAELLVYYVILTARLVPDKGKTSGYTELVLCLAFSLSCIIPTPASVSGRSFKTGVFLFFLPIISISLYVLETWENIRFFLEHTGPKGSLQL